MLSPLGPVMSGLEWHGNLELDDGYVRYSSDQASNPTVTVYDSRGRFVLGPMLTHDLGHEFLGHRFFLRLTGQVVAWAREILDNYQINADDVYVQVGQQGLWDFMAGRFLTWRVFRRGLGFDLYTLEDTGALSGTNFYQPKEFFQHMYEVNTIFMRDPSIGPVGRAAIHLYPTSWSGIELVGTYGHLNGAQNVFGGRLAFGIQPKNLFLLEHFSLLAGAEYQFQRPDLQKFDSNNAPCDKCLTERTFGAGGSLAFTPLRPIELAFSYAWGRDEKWADLSTQHVSDTTQSLGGYLQLDAGSLLMPRSLIAGGAWFWTEYRDKGGSNIYQGHQQIAAYLGYPLGFNNAVVKLVLSEAIGYQQNPNPPNVNAHMYSARLRFAYYY
jgi:hypothetical protein